MNSYPWVEFYSRVNDMLSKYNDIFNNEKPSKESTTIVCRNYPNNTKKGYIKEEYYYLEQQCILEAYLLFNSKMYFIERDYKYDSES